MSHPNVRVVYPGPRRAAPAPEAEPRRVRVGFLCPCLVMGGAEVWQALAARSLDPSRFEVVGVASLTDRVEPAMAAAYAGLCPFATGRAAARRLAAASDVLVLWAIDDLGGILAGASPRPRVVGVVHAPVESAWGQTVYARPRGIDRWVAVSDLALAALPPASLEAAPASVIRNAVDVDRLAVRRPRAEVRRAWGVPPDAPVAGYLGRLTDEKDPDAMIRLGAALPEPWHVVVVGDGGMGDYLRRNASGYPRIRLVGPDPAAGDVLNALDALVVPSLYESFGLTIAEGLWMGVPVVSTDVGIARIHPGLTYPVPVGAAGPDLADAVLRADLLGPAAGSRAWARAHLAPARFAREWSDLIAGLARARTPAPAPGRPAARIGDRLLLARGCDYAGAPLGCGCNKTRICLMGKGRPIPGTDAHEVAASDCLACVAGGDP